MKSRTSSARFIGDYTSSLTDSPLASAQWHGRFKGVRNRKTGKFKLQGAGARDLRRRDRRQGVPSPGLQGQAQRRTAARKKRGRGVFTMLGGEGGARTLRGTATVRVKLTRANKMRFRGTVTDRQGAERGFTPACSKLERKFGLTPLPD